MEIKNLKIKCGELHALTPVTSKPALEMTLLDVDLFELMQELIKSVGADNVLDHISDEEIKKYLGESDGN